MNIYYVYEKALFWHYVPRKSLALPTEHSATGFKDRITILACGNTAGTHKLKLLVIGKSSRRPRCLENIRVLPVGYKGNKNA